MMKIKKTNWFQEKKLSSCFALFTIMVIAIIIFSTTIFVAMYIKSIALENHESTEKINQSIKTLVFQAYENAAAAEDYSNLDKVITNMTENKILSYVYVLDNKSKRIVWSTLKGDVGKLETESEQYREALSPVDVIDEEEVIGATKIMVLGFTTGESHKGALNLMLSQIKWLVIFFLLIGLIASSTMGQILQKPFDRLIIGVNEFGKGNFKYRLQRTPFKEFNQLVGAYNSMALQLCDLYESLEQKVHERTVALEETNKQLKEAQGMMVHSEKMRSLGELVAGIAHEINNPINFIHGNIIHLEKYVSDIFELIKMFEEVEDLIPKDKFAKIKAFKDEIDVGFLSTDTYDLIKSCKEGTERTKNIVLDLKNFSRLDEMVLTEFDVSKEIDTTLNILNNKFKAKDVKILKNYEPNMPKIEAYGGQLNQVFMNILDNAIYAIRENGIISINILKHPQSENVIIEFSDNGVGISKENLKKVFDPFYTTKPVGSGTGLGMSIAYKVVTSHGGTMYVNSELGKGTTFRLIIPVNQKKEAYEQV